MNSIANRRSATSEASPAQGTEHTWQTFNLDAVARRFYDRFKVERSAFLQAIQGISSSPEREAYTSLILNRLMFLYFIQKKGLLERDPHYLSNRLRLVRERKNEHGSPSHQTTQGDPRVPTSRTGAGTNPSRQRSSAASTTCSGETRGAGPPTSALHTIPRMASHPVPTATPAPTECSAASMESRRNNGLSFYRCFLLPLFYERLVSLRNGRCNLFDAHEIEQGDAEIDISDEAFERIFAFFDTYQWRLAEGPSCRENEITPDILAYIFERYLNQKQAGAYYTDKDITEYIARNTIIPYLLKAVEKKCPGAFGSDSGPWRLLQKNPDRYIFEAIRRESYLPAETAKEYGTRRKRYVEIKARIVSGEVTCVGDMVTHNLDMRRFALDVIGTCPQPDLLRAFYTSLEQMRILDPTCGSGAFLLAALDILEPLYMACLERLPKVRPCSSAYLVLERIIANNLYGLDMMQDAAEMCKLRLFLKLIGGIECIEDIGLLSSIEFNIRTGNTLIGFPTFDDKQETRAQLDRQLAEMYGVDTDNEAEFERWRRSHQPFHWGIEYEQVMRDGGFDVIIGNPPYMEYEAAKQQYTVPQGVYETEQCGNLYALCMERFAKLGSTASVTGVIVPLSLVCTSRMTPLRRILYSTYSSIWFSNYDTIPGTLFPGIVQRNTIVLAAKESLKKVCGVYTTRNQKWHAQERSLLFASVCYIHIHLQSAEDGIPKVSSSIELDILGKVRAQTVALTSYVQRHSNNTLTYKRRWSYFLLFADHIQSIVLPDGSLRRQQDCKTLALRAEVDRYVILALLNSGLFYFHYCVFADFRHVNITDLAAFRFDYARLTATTAQRLSSLGKALMQSYADNLEWRVCNYAGSIGECLVPFYRQGTSKAIIDGIDRVLALHYGLSAEELDVIIHHDMKYRMRNQGGSQRIPSRVGFRETL